MAITHNLATQHPAFGERVLAHPVTRILLGILLTFGPVPLVMVVVAQMVAKPWRVAWPMLLAATLAWFGYRVWVARVERRQPTELALPGMAWECCAGAALGTCLLVLTFAVLAALGVYRISGANAWSVMLLVPLAEMVLVGLVEEMVFRGVVFGVTERSVGSKAAIAVSTLLFTLAHLPNDGVSVLAIAALVAFGVLQAALYMTTRRLWMCIGMHVAWNYCLSTVFAATVSGHAAKLGLLRGELTGNAILTGGAFGVEGSLVTLVLIGASAAVCLRRALRTASTQRQATPAQ